MADNKRKKNSNELELQAEKKKETKTAIEEKKTQKQVFDFIHYESHLNIISGYVSCVSFYHSIFPPFNSLFRTIRFGFVCFALFSFSFIFDDIADSQ